MLGYNAIGGIREAEENDSDIHVSASLLLADFGFRDFSRFV